MRKKILEIINSNEYTKMDASTIQKVLGLTGSQSFVQIMKTLNKLEEENIIGHTSKGKYDLLKRLNRFVGKIDLKEQGFGFVTTEELEVDIFIPKRQSLDALDKDTVLVELTSSLTKPEGRVIKVLKRNTEYLLGTLKQKGKSFVVFPDNFKIGIIATIPFEGLNDAKINDKVKAYITKYSSDGKCTGEIVSVIGKKTDPGIDVTMLLEGSMLRHEFPQAVIDYAEEIPQNVTISDYSHYRDLTNELIFTIDGDDARDFDDAVALKKLDNGNYLLGVYIADVTTYVTKDSPLDKEALERYFSIYLPDRVIPMLPFPISTGICSLNPNENRLVMACEMEINSQGEVQTFDIFEGIIKSKYRLTYKIVNQIFMDDPEKLVEYPTNLVSTLKEMKSLAEILGNARHLRGSLDFETKEASIIFDKNGKVEDIKVINRGISENLIEEFMIKANETVAEAMQYTLQPFIYRVHEEPRPEKLAIFKSIASRLGYHLTSKNGEVHPRALQQILEDSHDELQGVIINNLLLRSMAKARYNDVNLGHYGLASKCYTHFTSPIRRYPDLLVHRLLKDFYLNKKIEKIMELTDYYQSFVSDVALKASDKERQIERLERDCDDMKKCEYMAHYLDLEFEGVISSVTKWGFYVELANTVEGLVEPANMGVHQYFYDEELLCWHDKKSHKVFQIGDIVKVIVLAVSKERREIDFMIKEGSL